MANVSYFILILLVFGLFDSHLGLVLSFISHLSQRIVQNVAQKSGKVRIQFKAPPLPGKYKFTVSVKSQDFLGADQEFSMEATILDAANVERKEKEVELSTEDDKAVSEEAKKEQ